MPWQRHRWGEFAKLAGGSGNLASMSKCLVRQGLRRRRSEIARLPLYQGVANSLPELSPEKVPEWQSRFDEQVVAR